MKKIGIICMLLVLGISFHSCKMDNLVEPEVIFDDKSFMAELNSNTRLKIMAAQLVSSKSSNSDLRVFALSSIDENRELENEIKDLSAQYNIFLDTNLQHVHATNYSIISGTTSSEFDKLYLELVMLSLQESYEIVSHAVDSEDITNAELKSWAQSKMPLFQSQANQAEQMYAKLTY